jgi:hypothetical protein
MLWFLPRWRTATEQFACTGDPARLSPVHSHPSQPFHSIPFQSCPRDRSCRPNSASTPAVPKNHGAVTLRPMQSTVPAKYPARHQPTPTNRTTNQPQEGHLFFSPSKGWMDGAGSMATTTSETMMWLDARERERGRLHPHEYPAPPRSHLPDGDPWPGGRPRPGACM